YNGGGASGGWGCDAFEAFNPNDGGAGSNANLDERLRWSRSCVKAHCIEFEDDAAPPCKLCPIQRTLTPSNETVVLEADDCGRCIRESCWKELIRCCTQSVVTYTISLCGRPGVAGSSGAKC